MSKRKISKKTLSNGNNFYEIKDKTICIWGLNITPFEVDIDDEIREFINSKTFSIAETCEFNEPEDFELFDLIYYNK